MQGRMLPVFSSDRLPGSSRRKASDAPTTTLAPHQRGHDKRPHGQQKETHQFDYRWDEALVGYHHRTIVHERSPRNGGYQSRPARVNTPERNRQPVQEESQSSKEVREAVHAYLDPPDRLGCCEGGRLLGGRSAHPGIYRPLEGYAVDGLEDRERGGRRHRSGEGEGREASPRSRPGANGIAQRNEAAVCLRFFCYEEALNLLSQHYLSPYPERSTDSTALQG